VYLQDKNNIMNHIIRIVSLLFLGLFTSLSSLAEPAPFRAVYKADYKGLPVSAVGIRELKVAPNGEYILSSSAKSFLATVTEQSRFRIEEQKLIPLEYQYKRSGVGRNKKIDLKFDWSEGKASDEAEGWEIDITPGILDKLLYQFSMREDLERAALKNEPWPSMTYQIADDGRLKTYDFKVTGEEELETPVGKINTVKVIRVRKSEDRSTTFWLAPDYEFMLIRLQQIEKKNRGFELHLEEAEFNGKQIKASGKASGKAS
jgi:hypothetical protein